VAHAYTGVGIYHFLLALLASLYAGVVCVDEHLANIAAGGFIRPLCCLRLYTARTLSGHGQATCKPAPATRGSSLTFYRRTTHNPPV